MVEEGGDAEWTMRNDLMIMTLGFCKDGLVSFVWEIAVRVLVFDLGGLSLNICWVSTVE